MKRLFQIIVLVLPLFCSFHAFAGSDLNPQKGKIYVSHEQLELCSEGIYVNVGDAWYQTNALFSDEKGMYVQDLCPQRNGCRDKYVPCRNCDKCVKEIYNICPHCNKPV